MEKHARTRCPYKAAKRHLYEVYKVSELKNTQREYKGKYLDVKSVRGFTF